LTKDNKKEKIEKLINFLDGKKFQKTKRINLLNMFVGIQMIGPLWLNL